MKIPGGSYKATPEHLALWYRALEEEFGLELKGVGSPYMNCLYVARKEAGDPRLEALKITMMKDGSFWIVKKAADMKEDGDAPSLT